MLSDENRARPPKYSPFVHIYDLYAIQEKIALLCVEEYGLKGRNFNSLFSAFALKGAGKEKLVPFSYVYAIARRERSARDANGHALEVKTRAPKGDGQAKCESCGMWITPAEIKDEEGYYHCEVKGDEKHYHYHCIDPKRNPVLHALRAGPSTPARERGADPFVDEMVEDAMA